MIEDWNDETGFLKLETGFLKFESVTGVRRRDVALQRKGKETIRFFLKKI